MHARIVRGDGGRALERGFDLGLAALRQVEVGERDERHRRFHVEIDSFEERRFRGRVVMLCCLHARKRDVRVGVLRVRRDEILKLRDRAARVFQAGERVRSNELRGCVASIDRERFLGAALRVLIQAGQQQRLGGVELRADVGSQ